MEIVDNRDNRGMSSTPISHARQSIDLNADLGEDCGDDAAMLDLVTTANVAGGGHAGGGLILLDTVAAAVSRGVAVGAHPSYPDRENFGRVSRFSEITPAVLRHSITEQIVSVALALHDHGGQLHHVKAHGALYNDAAVNPQVAETFLSAITAIEQFLRQRGTVSLFVLPVMAMPNSTLAELAARAGRPVLFEMFADRAYLPTGRLVPRSESDAVLHDPEEIAARVLDLLATGEIKAVDGSRIPITVDTICVHGDNPNAVQITRRLRAALLDSGLSLKPNDG
jgi:UPF0271 protein